MTARSGSALYVGSVMHDRRVAPAHRFEYPLFMWLLDLDEAPSLESRVIGFGHNKARPIAFHDRDHLSGTDEPPREQLRRLVEREGLAWPAGPVSVLTHCRILGYVFNPVSFWYCHRPDGTLAVIVAEVNNTFGDRHCYVSPASELTAADAPAHTSSVRWSDKKVLHVSPFFSLDGTYAFAIEPPAGRLRARIDLRVAGVTQIVTALAMTREDVTRSSGVRVLARYPFMTLRVMAAIHREALRLWRKGARYHQRPLHDPQTAREGRV